MTDQQDTTPAVELLPCPFCAGEAELADVDAAYYVMCSVDGCWANSCVSLWRDRSEAIAAWSTRPAERTARPDDVAGEDDLAAKLAACDGLNWSEVCAYEADEDAEECNSRTCVAANCEDHDAGRVRDDYRRYARAAIAALSPQPASDDAAGEAA